MINYFLFLNKINYKDWKDNKNDKIELNKFLINKILIRLKVRKLTQSIIKISLNSILNHKKMFLENNLLNNNISLCLVKKLKNDNLFYFLLQFISLNFNYFILF